MNTDDTLSQSLKHYRLYWDLTQAELAAHFDFDERSVRRWESGKVKPRMDHLQKLMPVIRLREDTMDRREFFRQALTVSIGVAASHQQAELSQLIELLSSKTASFSIKEDLAIVEALTKTCRQLLPHKTNMAHHLHLTYVRKHRQKIESWLKTSPGSPIDRSLAEAISEIGLVEGEILYALKHTDEAEKSYETAIRVAREAGNLRLEAVGLTWFSNFFIDTGRSSKASAPADAARRKAEKGGATPLVRAWIAATEADAWANQHESAYKCEIALEKAAKFTSLIGTEQEKYPISYDPPWLFGYRGTVYAHLGRPQDGHKAQSELEQGLASLNAADTIRRWGFYKDLVIAHSLDRHVEEACHYAYLAMKTAEEAAPMYLQRAQNTSQQFLKPWKDDPIVKNLMDEFQLAHQKVIHG